MADKPKWQPRNKTPEGGHTPPPNPKKTFEDGERHPSKSESERLFPTGVLFPAEYRIALSAVRELMKKESQFEQPKLDGEEINALTDQFLVIAKHHDKKAKEAADDALVYKDKHLIRMAKKEEKNHQHIAYTAFMLNTYLKSDILPDDMKKQTEGMSKSEIMTGFTNSLLERIGDDQKKNQAPAMPLIPPAPLPPVELPPRPRMRPRTPQDIKNEPKFAKALQQFQDGSTPSIPTQNAPPYFTASPIERGWIKE